MFRRNQEEKLNVDDQGKIKINFGQDPGMGAAPDMGGESEGGEADYLKGKLSEIKAMLSSGDVNGAMKSIDECLGAPQDDAGPMGAESMPINAPKGAPSAKIKVNFK